MSGEGEALRARKGVGLVEDPCKSSDGQLVDGKGESRGEVVADAPEVEVGLEGRDVGLVGGVWGHTAQEFVLEEVEDG